jgi:hypothetical protein
MARFPGVGDDVQSSIGFQPVFMGAATPDRQDAYATLLTPLPAHKNLACTVAQSLRSDQE